MRFLLQDKCLSRKSEQDNDFGRISQELCKITMRSRLRPKQNSDLSYSERKQFPKYNCPWEFIGYNDQHF